MKRLPPRFGQPAGPQSSMPSQDESVAVSGTPFSPVNQPDVRQPFKTLIGNLPVAGDPDTGTPSAPRELADVRHVWDTRPPNAFDIWFEDRFQSNGNNNAPGGLFGPTLGGYRVPVGYNLFLRHMTVSAWVNPFFALAGGTNTAWAPNAFFQLEFAPQMSVFVDGVATPFWTAVTDFPNQTPAFPIGGVPLMFPTMHDYEIPCFIPVGGGSIVTANFAIPSFPLPNTNAIDNFIFFVQYHGNLVRDTGRMLTNEVGNEEPLPVTIEE